MRVLSVSCAEIEIIADDLQSNGVSVIPYTEYYWPLVDKHSAYLKTDDVIEQIIENLRANVQMSQT